MEKEPDFLQKYDEMTTDEWLNDSTFDDDWLVSGSDLFNRFENYDDFN